MNLRQLTPWLLVVTTAIIYLSFPTRVYYWDGIAFAQAIEDAPRLNASLVHPNHLIYNFIGYAFYKVLLTLGFEIRAVTALQILNALVSAGCAAVLFTILLDTLRSLYLSTCLTLLFAFSATWWKFSTDANAYIPSLLFLLLSFYLVLPGRKPKPLLLGIAFFVSMAFHQLAVLAWPVLALGVYLQNGPLSIKRRALNAVSFTVVAAALIAFAYSYLFYLASGSFDLKRLIHWTASYSADADTRFRVGSNLVYSLRGLVRLFFGGRINLLNGLLNPFVIVLIICLISATVLLILDTFRRLLHRRWAREFRLETRQKTVLLLSLFWALVYTVFLFFWLPQNTFYRLFYLPALILLSGLTLSSFERQTAKPRMLALFVISVALANFLFLIYPFSHVEKYPPLSFALQMNREWRAGTVIYYGAENADAGLIRYFNPATRWKKLSPKTIESDISEGGSAWLETTAIGQLSSTPQGLQWLKEHARIDSVKELNDGVYKIRFIQIY